MNAIIQPGAPWLSPDQLRHFHFGTEEPVLLSVSGGRTSGLMPWATFRADRPSYRQMLETVQAQGDIEDDGEESLPCGCHD